MVQKTGCGPQQWPYSLLHIVHLLAVGGGERQGGSIILQRSLG